MDKKIVFYLAFICAYFLWNEAHANKVIFQDRAIVRIDRQIYFSSDIKKLFGQLKKLDCLFGGSFLVEILDLKESVNQGKLPLLRSKNFPFLKAVVDLLKVEQQVGEKGKNYLSREMRKVISKNFKSCGVKNLKGELLKLVISELYVQERFLPNELNLDESGVKRYRKLFPDKDDNEIRVYLQSMENKKARQSLETFLRALAKKYEHFFYI